MIVPRKSRVLEKLRFRKKTVCCKSKIPVDGGYSAK